jgi:Bifunctional DNA primase/polymerase, N-terminal
MVDVVRRRGRRKAADRGERQAPLGQAAINYATLGWPVCVGAHLAADAPSTGRACSCDRVGCPAPGAHPVSPTWQMQATVDTPTIEGWWAARPEAAVILVTGRVFDVLEVPAEVGAAALAGIERAGLEAGPVGQAGGRMLFFVTTRGAPVDEDEWWSCRLDCEPENITSRGSLRWHCRDSYVLAPPSAGGLGVDGPGGVARWIRDPADHPLPDPLRLLEFLVDACEEAGLS